jgi:hypothetical protein
VRYQSKFFEDLGYDNYRDCDLNQFPTGQPCFAYQRGYNLFRPVFVLFGIFVTHLGIATYGMTD